MPVQQNITRENILESSDQLTNKEVSQEAREIAADVKELVRMLDAFKANNRVYEKNRGYSNEAIQFLLTEAERIAAGEKEAIREVYDSQSISGLKKGMDKFKKNRMDRNKFLEKDDLFKLQRAAMVEENNKIIEFFSKLKEDSKEDNISHLTELKKEWEAQAQFATYNSYQLEEYYRNLKSVKEKVFEFYNLIEDILSSAFRSLNTEEVQYYDKARRFLKKQLIVLESQEKRAIAAMAERIKVAEYYNNIECDDVVAYMYDQLSQIEPDAFPRKNRVKRNKPFIPLKEKPKTLATLVKEKENQEQKIAADEFILLGSDKEITPLDVDQLHKRILKRHQAIIGMHQDLLDVNQMFKDVKKLVEAQQPGLDLIQVALERALAEAQEAYEFILEAEKQQIARLGDTVTDNIIVAFKTLLDKLSAAWTISNFAGNPVVPKPAVNVPFLGAVYTAVSLGQDLLPQNMAEIGKMSLSGFLSFLKDIKSNISDKLSENVREEHRKKINKFKKEYHEVADPIRDKYFGRGKIAITSATKDVKHTAPPKDVKHPASSKSETIKTKKTKPQSPPKIGFMRTDLDVENASRFYAHLAQYYSESTKDKSKDTAWKSLNKREFFKKPANLQNLELTGEAEIKLAGSAIIWHTLNSLENDLFLRDKKIKPLSFDSTHEPYEITHFKELVTNLKKAEAEFKRIQDRVESGVYRIGSRSEYTKLQETIQKQIAHFRQQINNKKAQLINSAQETANRLRGDIILNLSEKPTSPAEAALLKEKLTRLQKLINTLEEKPESDYQPSTDPVPILFQNMRGLIEAKRFTGMAGDNAIEIISTFNPGGRINDAQRERLSAAIVNVCEKFHAEDLEDQITFGARILESIPTEHVKPEDLAVIVNRVAHGNRNVKHALSLTEIEIASKEKKEKPPRKLSLHLPSALATIELKKDLIEGSHRVDFIKAKQTIFTDMNNYLTYLVISTGQRQDINYEKIDLEISFQIIDKMQSIIKKETEEFQRFEQNFKGVGGILNRLRHDKTLKMRKLWIAQLAETKTFIQKKESQILNDLLFKSDNIKPYITQNGRLLISRVEEIRKFIESRDISADLKNQALHKLDVLCVDIITNNFKELFTVEINGEKSASNKLAYLASVKTFLEKRKEINAPEMLKKALTPFVTDYLARYHRNGDTNTYAPLFTLLGNPEWIAEFGKARFERQIKSQKFNFDQTDHEFLEKNKGNAVLMGYFNAMTELLVREKTIPWNTTVASFLEKFAAPEIVYQYRINFIEQMLHQPNQHLIKDDVITDQIYLLEDTIGTRFPIPPLVDKKNAHAPSTQRLSHLFNSVNHWTPSAEILISQFGDLEQRQRLHLLCAQSVLGVKGPKMKVEEELSLRQELWLRIQLEKNSTPESLIHFFGVENLRILYKYFSEYLDKFIGKENPPYNELTLREQAGEMEVAPESVVNDIRQIGGNFNAFLKLITTPEVTKALGVDPHAISFMDVEQRTAYLQAERDLNALTKVMHHDIRNRDANGVLQELKIFDTTLAQPVDIREKEEQSFTHQKIQFAKKMWMRLLNRIARNPLNIANDPEKLRKFLRDWNDPSHLPRESAEFCSVRADADLWIEVSDAKQAYESTLQNKKPKPFDFRSNPQMILSHFKIPVLDSFRVNAGKLTYAGEYQKLATLLRSDFFTLGYHQLGDLINPSLELLTQKLPGNRDLAALKIQAQELLASDKLPNHAKAQQIQELLIKIERDYAANKSEVQNAVNTLRQFAKFSAKLTDTYHYMSDLLNQKIESKYYELFSADIGKEGDYENDRVISDLELLASNVNFPHVLHKIRERAKVYLANFERANKTNSQYAKLFSLLFTEIHDTNLVAEYGRIRFQNLALKGFQDITAQDISFLHDNRNNAMLMKNFELIAAQMVPSRIPWSEKAAVYIEIYAKPETIYLYRLKRMNEILADQQISREAVLKDIQQLKKIAREHIDPFIPSDSVAGKSLAQTLKDIKHWTMGAEVLVSLLGTPKQLQDLHTNCVLTVLSSRAIGQEELGMRALLKQITTPEEFITFFGKENLKILHAKLISLINKKLLAIREIKPLTPASIDSLPNEINVMPEEVVERIRQAAALPILFDLFNHPQILEAMGLKDEEATPMQLVNHKISRLSAERDLNALTKHFFNTAYNSDHFDRAIKEYKEMDAILLRSAVEMSKDQRFKDSVNTNWKEYIALAKLEVSENERLALVKKWEDPTAGLFNDSVYLKVKEKLKKHHIDLDEGRRIYQLVNKKMETASPHNYKKDPSIIFTHYKIPMLQNLRVAMDYFARTQGLEEAAKKVKELFNVILGSYLSYLDYTIQNIKKIANATFLSQPGLIKQSTDLEGLIHRISKRTPQIPTHEEAEQIQQHVMALEKLAIPELKTEVNNLKNFSALIMEIRKTKDQENAMRAVNIFQVITFNLLQTIAGSKTADISKIYVENIADLKELILSYSDQMPEEVKAAIKKLHDDLKKNLTTTIALTAGQNPNIPDLFEDIQKNPGKYQLNLADLALYNTLLKTLKDPSIALVTELREQLKLMYYHREFVGRLGKPHLDPSVFARDIEKFSKLKHYHLLSPEEEAAFVNDKKIFMDSLALLFLKFAQKDTTVEHVRTDSLIKYFSDDLIKQVTTTNFKPDDLNKLWLYCMNRLRSEVITPDIREVYNALVQIISDKVLALENINNMKRLIASMPDTKGDYEANINRIVNKILALDIMKAIDGYVEKIIGTEPEKHAKFKSIATSLKISEPFNFAAEFNKYKNALAALAIPDAFNRRKIFGLMLIFQAAMHAYNTGNKEQLNAMLNHTQADLYTSKEKNAFKEDYWAKGFFTDKALVGGNPGEYAATLTQAAELAAMDHKTVSKQWAFSMADQTLINAGKHAQALGGGLATVRFYK